MTASVYECGCETRHLGDSGAATATEPAGESLGSPKAEDHRHAGIGYATSDDEHAEAVRKPLLRLAWNKPGSTDLPDTEPNEETRAHRDPPMLCDSP